MSSLWEVGFSINYRIRMNTFGLRQKYTLFLDPRELAHV